MIASNVISIFIGFISYNHNKNPLRVYRHRSRRILRMLRHRRNLTTTVPAASPAGFATVPAAFPAGFATVPCDFPQGYNGKYLLVTQINTNNPSTISAMSPRVILTRRHHVMPVSAGETC